jgi:hypothetical protein
MISTWRFKGHAHSSLSSKRSHARIRTLTPRSSRFEIRTDIALRSVRSLRPDKARQVRLNQHRGQRKNAARLGAELAAARSNNPSLNMTDHCTARKLDDLKRFYRVIANDERSTAVLKPVGH